MADYRHFLDDAGADTRPSPPCTICYGLVFSVATSVKSYLHAFSRPTHQTIATCFPGARSSAICPFFSESVQDHSLFWCGVSCNVPPLFDFLLNSQEVFWSCPGYPSFAFPCLPAHRIRQSLLACFSHAPPTLSTSPSVCFFLVSNSQWCPAPVPREKLGNVHVKQRITPRRVVDAWCSNHHFLRQ